MKVYSFPFISNKYSKVLVLGTIPSIASLELNQYYGHSRNAFWKLLFTIFEEPFSPEYETRKKLVLKNKIAIWDVLQACEREGSLDSAIEQEVPNNFEQFLTMHPQIELIVFNGQKAAKFFNQYVSISKDYTLVTLPSTSPTNASISFERKLEFWGIVKSE